MTSAHLTSGLNEVTNDTGRIAFCGPYVLAAITGYPISRMEDEIRTFRNIPTHRKPIIKGTDNEEVAAALAHFGYRMDMVESYMHLERKERSATPTPRAAGSSSSTARTRARASWRCSQCARTWAFRAAGCSTVRAERLRRRFKFSMQFQSSVMLRCIIGRGFNVTLDLKHST
jgi:hypothetical protein